MVHRSTEDGDYPLMSTAMAEGLYHPNCKDIVSDKIKIKPKQLHNIDMQVTEAYKVLGIGNDEYLPKVVIITNIEMNSNAVAAYNAILNTLYVDENFGNINKIKKLQRDGVCPDNPISTLMHECIHYMDAKE